MRSPNGPPFAVPELMLSNERPPQGQNVPSPEHGIISGLFFCRHFYVDIQMNSKQSSLRAPSITPAKSCLFTFSFMHEYTVLNLSFSSPFSLFFFLFTSCLGRLRLRGRSDFV